VALVGAGLCASGACHQVCGEARRDGRKWASEGRVDGREDAEQHSEGARTHGGSVLKSQYGTWSRGSSGWVAFTADVPML
jgi:hypothetical protein